MIIMMAACGAEPIISEVDKDILADISFLTKGSVIGEMLLQ